MATDISLQRTVDQLTSGESVMFTLHRFDVSGHLDVDASKLSLKTVVYSAIDYIPPTVRSCVNKHQSYSSYSSSFLSIDEEHFQIYLHERFVVGHLTPYEFDEIISQFIELAETWRSRFDEYDKEDLVHITVK